MPAYRWVNLILAWTGLKGRPSTVDGASAVGAGVGYTAANADAGTLCVDEDGIWIYAYAYAYTNDRGR